MEIYIPSGMPYHEVLLTFEQEGGTAGKDSVNYRVSLPAPWIKDMGLNENDRELELEFDGEKIIIKKL